MRALKRAVHGSLGDFRTPVTLSAEQERGLSWLVANVHRHNGSSLYTNVQVSAVLTTDASPFAFGAILQLPSGKVLRTSGFFSKVEAKLPQNEREAIAVWLSIQTFTKILSELASLLQASHVHPLQILCKGDNVSVVAYLRRLGGRKKRLSKIIEATLKWGFDRCWRLLAEWIPGTEMPADAWSRELALQDQADWETSWVLYDKICAFFHLTPSMDLFASRHNTKARRFFSMRPDPQAAGWDALSKEKNWGREGICFAAPPTHLIAKVVAKAQYDRASVILVTPAWGTAPWWAALLAGSEHKQMEFEANERNFVRRNGLDPTRWPGRMATATLLSPCS